MRARTDVTVPNPRRRSRLVKTVASCAVVVLVAAIGWGTTAHNAAPSGPPGTGAVAGEAGSGDSRMLARTTDAATGSAPGTTTAAKDGSAAKGKTGATVSTTDLAQKVVRTASLSLITKGGLDAALRRVNEILAAHRGYVATLSQNAGETDDADTADVTLRVPAERFAEVMDELGGLGEVTARSVKGDDVTQRSVDIDARLRALQAQSDAFGALLAKATSIPDVLAVREQLDAVLTQIEQLTAERKSLDDSVALATIEVSLAEPGAVTAPGPTPYWREVLDAAAERIGRVGAALVVGLATLLVPGLLVGLGWLAWRRSRRQRSAPGASPTPSAA